MKIFHAADIHYCARHLRWVHRAFSQSVDEAINAGCELAVLAGDIFDAAVGLHEPAVDCLLSEVERLAESMPVFVLQGTQSHDRPGSLDVLRHIRGQYPVYVAGEVVTVGLYRNDDDDAWFSDRIDIHGADTYTNVTGSKLQLVINAIPSLNRAAPDVEAEGAAAWAANTLECFAHVNVKARSAGIPSILVTHGTVTGSITESRFAMVSPDHEFSIDALCRADANAVMLGHIHKHQSWRCGTPSGANCLIAYSGSTAKLVHGQHNDTGYVLWSVEPDGTSLEFRPVESRNMVSIEFDGTPDMETLAGYASCLGENDHVRIRWSVDQEHAHSIDQPLIREIFNRVGGLKIEGTVNAIQSVRAPGIGLKPSLFDRLRTWLTTTGDQDACEILFSDLERLQAEDPETIAARITGRGDQS